MKSPLALLFGATALAAPAALAKEAKAERPGVPALGLGLDPDDSAPALGFAASVAAIGSDHLICHLIRVAGMDGKASPASSRSLGPSASRPGSRR